MRWTRHRNATSQVTGPSSATSLPAGCAATASPAPCPPIETTDPVAADTTLTVAALWQPGGANVELVPFTVIDGRRIR